MQQTSGTDESCGTREASGSRTIMPGEPDIVRVIHQGDTAEALRLLREGSAEGPVDPNHRTEGGWSLLHMAALGDMPEVVRALLDAGAEIDADDGHGLRPVHYAVSWDAQGALSVLLERGADLRCTSKDQIFYLNKIIPVFVVGGRTPLHFAAEKGYYECAKMLLDAGADPTVLDLSGRTAYDLAVNGNRMDIASLLRPDLTEHVASLPKDFHSDRRGVEARTGRRAPLPSLRPFPTSGENALPSSSVPEPLGSSSSSAGSELEEMLSQASALLDAIQKSPPPRE